jgi:hypothetical protein
VIVAPQRTFDSLALSQGRLRRLARLALIFFGKLKTGSHRHKERLFGMTIKLKYPV